jgi:hypothetical protein
MLCLGTILEIIKLSFGLIIYMTIFIGFIRLITKILEKIGLFSFMEKGECMLINKVKTRAAHRG